MDSRSDWRSSSLTQAEITSHLFSLGKYVATTWNCRSLITRTNLVLLSSRLMVLSGWLMPAQSALGKRTAVCRGWERVWWEWFDFSKCSTVWLKSYDVSVAWRHYFKSRSTTHKPREISPIARIALPSCGHGGRFSCKTHRKTFKSNGLFERWYRGCWSSRVDTGTIANSNWCLGYDYLHRYWGRKPYSGTAWG